MSMLSLSAGSCCTHNQLRNIVKQLRLLGARTSENGYYELEINEADYEALRDAGATAKLRQYAMNEDEQKVDGPVPPLYGARFHVYRTIDMKVSK